MNSTTCTIKSLTPITEFVFRAILIPTSPITFKAGQYINILISEKDKRAFSIASLPGEAEIELHLGAAEPNAYAKLTLEKLQHSQTVTIDGPHGNAWLRASDRPLLLVAGGTGYSYARSILLQALQERPERRIFLYWGGRKDYHLYDVNFINDLVKQHPSFTFVPVVESLLREPMPVNNNLHDVRSGKVIDAVMSDFPSLKEYDIYLAGRFEMSGIARKLFIQERYAVLEHMYSDAFAFI